MTKQEIEKAIENGESVWIIGEDIQGKKKVGTKRLNKYDKILNNKLNGFWRLNKIFKTKVEAEHYLHHANITRTEKLPFYTFNEIVKDEKNFKMGKTYTLIEDKNFVLDINKSYVSQIVLYTGKEKYSWNFNEENFYKAYDECVRLFKG